MEKWKTPSISAGWLGRIPISNLATGGRTGNIYIYLKREQSSGDGGAPFPSDPSNSSSSTSIAQQQHDKGWDRMGCLWGWVGR